MAIQVAVLKETDQGERRVAVVPQTVRRFAGRGWVVKVQSGAGLGSSISDEQFAQAGATIAPDARAALVFAPVGRDG